MCLLVSWPGCVVETLTSVSVVSRKLGFVLLLIICPEPPSSVPHKEDIPVGVYRFLFYLGQTFTADIYHLH